MADDKKRKIDLKARLGKKTVKGGPDVPPPVGIPKPVGVPVPPFAAGQSRPAGPKVDASDPYAAISAEHAVQKEQTLKVEMSEEVVQAQKKGRTLIIVLAVAMAGIGGLLGFTIGGRVESNKGALAAVQGAGELAKEVDAANLVIQDLAEVLKDAQTQLQDNKYPEAAVTKLGGINIPFAGANLFGKGIGRYKPETQKLLFSFTAAAEAANGQKDRVHRFLGAKTTVTDYLDQKSNPKVRWISYVLGGPHGPWAVMERVPSAFLATSKEKVKDKDGKEKDYAWPDEFEIPDGNKKVKLKRYSRGDPTGNEPKVIPVDPSTYDAVCPSDVITRLVKEVSDLDVVLRGDATPGHEKIGLIQLGEQVVEQLNKIGKP